MSIEIDGLNELITRLTKVVDRENVKGAITTATFLLESEAAKKAPKGDLQQSITSKIEDLTGTVYTPLYYAPYVEYGTGLFSTHPKGGRKEVPWVYVEGNTGASKSKTIHTEESAAQAVAFLRSKGLPAFSTVGQHPQPYMRPALYENQQKILEIIKGGILD